jgi:hypothetical protein
MKRGTGILALFAFLLTGIRFASGPATIRETSEVNAAEAIKPAPKMPAHIGATCPAFEYPSASTANSENAQQREEGEGEIAELVDRFVYGANDGAKLQAGGLPEGIRLMIVSVPDPRHTHLSLQFDRTLEAVQQAAQDEKYTYDSSWLPWKSTESANHAEQEAEQKEAANREMCPGLLLFRKAMSGVGDKNCKDVSPGAPLSGNALFRCGMLVFVVTEKPTGGLNRTQWDNALRWIDKYAGKARPDNVLRVLGPTFSGSLPSYVRALEESSMYSGTFSGTLLYTGRIRGCGSWRWLGRTLNPEPSAGVPPTPVRLPVRTADFEENDALQTDRFFRFLKDRGHRLAEVAVLSEDETAYGGLPDAAPRPRDPVPANDVDAAARSAERKAIDEEGSCISDYPPSDRPVHLYYPRDISALRSAYQEQSIFSSGSKGDTSSGTPHTVLRPESSASDRNGSDTVELFGGANIALTQEAQMYGIVNTLQTHGIRFIMIRSTNSLDYLFLARFLHRAYPSAYLVTMGSDLLFGREVDSTEFRGITALSSFPLLPRGQDWTQQVENTPQHAHRTFGSYTMEGSYLAARFLITDPKVTVEETHSGKPFVHPGKPDIPDYAFPFWDKQTEDPNSEPATWLSVVGRDGYWPLATLTEPLENTKRFSNLALVAKSHSQPAGDGQNAPRKPQLSLSSSWRFFCVLALLIFGMHYFACRYGYRRPNLGMFVQFTRLDSWRGPALIAAGWAVICSLLIILFLTSARIFKWLDFPDKAWVVIMGIGSAAAFGLALLELRWWSEPFAKVPAETIQQKVGKAKHRNRSHRPMYRVFAASMFAAILAFAVAVWLIYEFGHPSESAVTAAYRSVHLTSGVSPVVSLIALLAGFYWWFWQSLSGLALLGNGRPVLPRSAQERLSKVGNRMAEGIERTAIPFPPFGESTFLLYLLPLLLVALLALVLQRAWMEAFDMVLHTMENAAFNRTLHVLIAVALYLVLVGAMQFYSTWLGLNRLLQALDRSPLRRTFGALQGLSMRSLWRFSGTSSRSRHKIFSRQMESLVHLRNELESAQFPKSGTLALRESVRTAWQAGQHFVVKRGDDDKDFAMVNDMSAHAIRLTFQACSEVILEDLLAPAWDDERESMAVPETPAEGSTTRERIKLSENAPVKAGEEFVCLMYVGYLQNLLGRMRTMVLSMAGIFAAIALSVGFYPFTPRPTISLALLSLLLLIGAVVGVVFAGLDRDSTLSHITNTEPGALGAHFWLRMLSFIGVPALGLIVAQFPEITDFVFSWVTPTMSNMK